jgi:hypothetical protein
MTPRAWNARHDELNVTPDESACRLDLCQPPTALGFIGSDDGEQASA